MCVAMVIIQTKTLEKKSVDDVRCRVSVQPHQPSAMSQLFSCGIMESGWAGVPQLPVSSSLENLWDGVSCSGGISTLLRDLSLGEASSCITGPPSKRQCRSLSCTDELGGCRAAWRPQGSGVWTAVEKRRHHSGDVSSAQSAAAFPIMQRSSSLSLPTCHEPPACPPLILSQQHVAVVSSCPARLARSRSQPCVHNHKISLKRRRPADPHRPSLDLAKMSQKLPDFQSLSGGSQTPLSDDSDVTQIYQPEAGKQCEHVWERQDERVTPLGGDLDIEQIERN